MMQRASRRAGRSLRRSYHNYPPSQQQQQQQQYYQQQQQQQQQQPYPQYASHYPHQPQQHQQQQWQQPPPPHGYPQPHEYPPPQYQQYQQQAQEEDPETSNQKGSWSNPLIIARQPGVLDRFFDILLVGGLIYMVGSYFSVFSIDIVFVDGSEDDDEEEEGEEGERSGKSRAAAAAAAAAASSKKDADAEEKPAKDKDEKPSRMSALFGGTMDDEKVKPVDLTQTSHSVTWDDVLGCDEAKGELIEVTEFLKHPDKFTRLGGKLPKGYLLVGPPGTGKTMLAKAIAKEAGVPFFYASGSQFEEVYVGVGSKRVRELFAAAREHSPCLVFIDEIDAVGGKRSPGDLSRDRSTINQLLAEMDGFNSSESVVVIAATNSAGSLDKALTRPGRLDRQVAVDPPDLKGRKQILSHYLSKVTTHKDVQADVIARGTSGMTGAELSNVVNIATINAAKRNLETVTLDCLEEAKDRVVMGIEHKTRRIPEHERENTAYHEAGHALVALHSDHTPPLHKATIIPRGQSLGVTVQLPEADQMSMSLAEMKSRLRVLMGGRIAEEVVFGHNEVTSGASNDLEQATKLSRAMVRKYGLSPGMGMVDYSFEDDPNGMFLSNKTRAKIDNEVKNLVDQAYADAHALIIEHRETLNGIAKGLLENDTLTGKDMREIAGMPEPKQSEK